MVLVEKQLCFSRKHSSSHLGFYCQTHALIFSWKKRAGQELFQMFSIECGETQSPAVIWETWKKVLERLQGSCGKPNPASLHLIPLFWVLNAARGASWGQPKITSFSCVSSSTWNPWNELFSTAPMEPGPPRHQNQAVLQFPGNNNTPSWSRKFSALLVSAPRFLFQSGMPGLPEHLDSLHLSLEWLHSF